MVTNVVIRATEGFNLQCNNVATLRDKLKKNVARITGPLWLVFTSAYLTQADAEAEAVKCFIGEISDKRCQLSTSYCVCMSRLKATAH